MDRGPPRPHQDRLHEGAHEGPRLRDLAGPEELAHLLGEGRHRLRAVQHHAPLGQHHARLVRRHLQLALPLAVLLDALRGVGQLEVGVLDDLPDAAQLAPHLLQLRLDTLKLLALLAGDAVHLLVEQAHEVTDVGLGEDVVAQLADDRLLEAPRVEPGGDAGLLAALEQGLADVVGVLAALRLRGGEIAPAALTAHEPAQQVGTGDPPGVLHLRSARAQQLLHALELLPANDRRHGALHAHGRGLPLVALPPDQRAHVGLVAEHPVHGVLEPAAAVAGGDAIGVEGAHDVEHAVASERHREDAADDGVGGRVEFELGALLRAVLDLHLAVAVGGEGGDPEAARGRLAHAARDLFGQIGAVEFVDALDDRLHELAGGRVVGVLGDGDDAHAASAQHRLEGDGVLALAREAAELPDEDLLEGRVGLARLVEHLAELRPVGDATALGLVDVLAHDAVAALLGVFAQGAQLGGDGEVDILAVAGDTRVERDGRGIGSMVRHRFVLL